MKKDLTLHRDGRVTLWNVLSQTWDTYPAREVGTPGCAVPAAVLATLSDVERVAISRHAAKRARGAS